jgi:hypothetical protein
MTYLVDNNFEKALQTILVKINLIGIMNDVWRSFHMNQNYVKQMNLEETHFLIRNLIKLISEKIIHPQNVLLQSLRENIINLKSWSLIFSQFVKGADLEARPYRRVHGSTPQRGRARDGSPNGLPVIDSGLGNANSVYKRKLFFENRQQTVVGGKEASKEPRHSRGGGKDYGRENGRSGRRGSGAVGRDPRSEFGVVNNSERTVGGQDPMSPPKKRESFATSFANYSKGYQSLNI